MWLPPFSISCNSVPNSMPYSNSTALFNVFFPVRQIWKSLYKLLLQLFSTFICQRERNQFGPHLDCKAVIKDPLSASILYMDFWNWDQQRNINFRKAIFNCQAGARTVWNLIWRLAFQFPSLTGLHLCSGTFCHVQWVTCYLSQFLVRCHGNYYICSSFITSAFCDWHWLWWG